MFRATILPIIRSFWLCNAACGMLYPICCWTVICWRSSSVTRSSCVNVLGTTYHKLYCTVKSSWRWAKLLPETCGAKFDLSINSYCCIYHISVPIRRTFFSQKCDLNSTRVLCAEGKYYFQTYKYQYIYYTTSLSWYSEICFQIMRSGITACEQLTFLAGDLP